jgi:hypothetical protein
MKQKIVHKTSILLLIFIGYFQYNLIMNRHAHFIEGHIIYHSHPYQSNPFNKSPYQSHPHSSSVFFLLDQISNPTSIVSMASVYLTAIFLLIRAIQPIYFRYIPTAKYLFYHHCRPPPQIF